MSIMFWIGIGLMVIGAGVAASTYIRLDKNEDRMSYIWTAVRVLPGAIWRALPDFLLVWDTEVKLAMMKPGKELGKDF